MVDHTYYNIIMQAPATPTISNSSSTHLMEGQVSQPVVMLCAQGDEMIIDLVKSYPYLYDKTKTEFKDIAIRRNAWSEISKNVGMSAKEVENRWTRLRERFSKERKAMDQPSGSGTQQSSDWPLFQKLMFLNEHVKRRNTIDNMKKKNEKTLKRSKSDSIPNYSTPMGSRNRTISSSSSSTTLSLDCVDSDTSITDSFPVPVDSDVEFDPLEPESTIQTPPSITNGSGNFKKIKQNQLVNELSALSSSITNFLQKKTASTNERSINTTSVEHSFAQLIVGELEKMPDEIRRDRKMKIMQILYEPY